MELNFDTFIGDAIDCLVRDLKILSIPFCFLPSFFQALFILTHYSAYCFLCIYGCNTPVIPFFVDHNVWGYACFSWPKTGRLKLCTAALEVLHPLKLLLQITDSILGPAFISISMVCNSKILPTIMQIKVVYIYVVPCGCSEFAFGEIKKLEIINCHVLSLS